MSAVGTPIPKAPTLAEDLLLLLFQPTSGTIAAVPGSRPSDELFAPTWGYVSEKPRSIHAVLAAIGPQLRKPVLERLVVRGDIREVTRKRLGIFTTTRLIDGGPGRRDALLHDVRAALLGEEPRPTERVAALAALLYGSGALPQFDPVIPWSSSVISRAKEFTRDDVGATAANEAVTRTVSAIIVNSVITSSAAAAVNTPQ